MSEGTTTGEISNLLNPRFEFRSFGQHFEQAAHRMSRLSMPVPEHLWDRSSEETYIVSRTRDQFNTKIRDGKMDIKSLVQTTRGLELWKPLLKTEFPVSSDWISAEWLPVLEMSNPNLSGKSYSYQDFISWINQDPGLQVVHLRKRRFAYLIGEVICETGEVLINGAKVQTISCESANPDEVINTIKNLGLSGVENINYIQMIKRVTGIVFKPLAN